MKKQKKKEEEGEEAEEEGREGEEEGGEEEESGGGEKKAEVVLPSPPAEKLPSFLEVWQSDEGALELGPVMTDEQKARLATKRPLTKEEYDARQSVIRKVVDPETGRTRLVRGEGEIIEEMVTKDRHKEINKQSTKGDGNAFQKKLGINR
ncbi:hypothetical protein F7725_012561 [Dissostichus mawsoni]|uniref:ADP-ribosylation factor-like protein 6-interacting protein 4 n=1 Tax=Dissostichus mawsoni TaxID=36200 RepID=A0A7J5YPY2_DISMA|nr:hypothetical protein F7725_012561 [Dissostichus mawsoni]